ncbi:hypothetical protein OE88DRAFT_1032109 [Heliocybe sulcata]|uniref:Secreted protein n=1 Tax=Heliocybe sulcata TaxID=5364 RepID=A0A5C3NBW0_9AGAM|nr:hypothetical protein OE88DRAFT_1032109 [Heliocybe sulcata]
MCALFALVYATSLITKLVAGRDLTLDVHQQRPPERSSLSTTSLSASPMVLIAPDPFSCEDTLSATVLVPATSQVTS